LDNKSIEDLQKSLGPEIEANMEQIFASGEGMGKSGSFFFFSHDGNFLIKTMTSSDFQAFMKIFKYYFEHINLYPNSLLARIYGVYSVKMDESLPVYLILMGNSKKCDNRYLKANFDLKGSTSKREVFDKGQIKNTTTLKDLNLIKIKNEENCLLFQTEDIKAIMTQVGYDISLLNQFNLMDYSLLLAIEYNPEYVRKYPSEFLQKDETQIQKERSEKYGKAYTR